MRDPEEHARQLAVARSKRRVVPERGNDVGYFMQAQRKSVRARLLANVPTHGFFWHDLWPVDWPLSAYAERIKDMKLRDRCAICIGLPPNYPEWVVEWVTQIEQHLTPPSENMPYWRGLVRVACPCFGGSFPFFGAWVQ